MKNQAMHISIKSLQQQKIFVISCGKAVLRIDSLNQQLLQSSFIKSELQKVQWKFQYFNYYFQGWNQIFSNMIQTSVVQISLHSNKYSNIIKQIQHVDYLNLRKLFLSKNNIQNIQPLSWTKYSYLQSLDLSGNQISQIKCLKKFSMKFFNTISIKSNPISQINYLTLSKTNDDLFKCLTLQLEPLQNSVHQDLSIIITLPSKLLEMLCLRSQDRINQAKIQMMLKQRFPQIQVYQWINQDN